MTEILSTRANHLVDPFVHVWGWEIPVYLFLGGWVAGVMILAGFFLWHGRHTRRACTCFVLPLLAIVVLSLGMGALFLDLEHKLYTWRLYLTFVPWSPMSWGAWILILVYPVLAAMSLVRPPALLAAFFPVLDEWSEALNRRPRALKFLAGTSMASGAALGIYTGVLLSALGARPFWNSALLGPLFLASGLSAGAAFAHMVARDPEEGIALARADNAFLMVELLLIGLLLIGLGTTSEAHAAAVGLVLGGPFTAVFWVLVVGLGILVPLLIQGLAVTHRITHTPIAPMLVMLGSLALRFVVVYAGQYSHWARV